LLSSGHGSGHGFRSTLEAMTATRITRRADQMGGVPCIRGLRIPVTAIVRMVAEGMTVGEIVDAYPDLEPADVQEAVRWDAESQ
jgi:uncharacterized protein (DUF433 family)